jgi:hypothetical protein
MADAEHTTPGLVPGLVQEFMGQLRAATEKLEGLTGLTPGTPTRPCDRRRPPDYRRQPLSKYFPSYAR